MAEPPGRVCASFEADPSSAGRARRVLRQLLVTHGREGLLDDAELVLSEVVANVVLHAHTPFTVDMAVLADGGLRVEVRDGNPQLPVQRHHLSDAPTGRGMRLISALSAAFGTEALGAEGKAVWFVIREDGPDQDDADPDALLAAWDVDLEEAARSAGGPVPVSLLGLPAGLWLRARAHHDAILRELALYASAHPRDAPTADELAHADRARAWVSTRVVAEVDRVSDVLGTSTAEEGPHLDLRLEVPPDAAHSFHLLGSTLDAAERLAHAGALLVAPGRPDVVAVRSWVCDEALGQLGGRPASRWGGPG